MALASIQSVAELENVILQGISASRVSATCDFSVSDQQTQAIMQTSRLLRRLMFGEQRRSAFKGDTDSLPAAVVFFASCSREEVDQCLRIAGALPAVDLMRRDVASERALLWRRCLGAEVHSHLVRHGHVQSETEDLPPDGELLKARGQTHLAAWLQRLPQDLRQLLELKIAPVPVEQGPGYAECFVSAVDVIHATN